MKTITEKKSSGDWMVNMRIEQPIKDVDLFIAYDVLNSKQYENLVKYATTRSLREAIHKNYLQEFATIGSWEMAEIEDFLENGTPPELWDEGQAAIDTLRKVTKEVMIQCYPDLDLVRFNDFGDISIRTPHHQTRMKPHVDGPPEIVSPNHGIKNLGSNYYLNDEYVGGELYYPNLDFSYKPVPNSLVIHRGAEELFRHGVNDVSSGVRFSFGMFSFEHYEEEMFTMSEGLDNDVCSFKLRPKG